MFSFSKDVIGFLDEFLDITFKLLFLRLFDVVLVPLLEVHLNQIPTLAILGLEKLRLDYIILILLFIVFLIIWLIIKLI